MKATFFPKKVKLKIENILWGQNHSSESALVHFEFLEFLAVEQQIS